MRRRQRERQVWAGRSGEGSGARSGSRGFFFAESREADGRGFWASSSASACTAAS